MKTNRTVVGVDTAKRVFQLHWVDMQTGEIVDLKLTRAKFLVHFANLAPCVAAMEACGGSQHWARRLRELGHDPWLLPAKAVRPFVTGNKNDAHDARAIWTAAQMPGIKTVAVKSEEQQGVLALHRMRQQLVKFRTAQINGLRGLLTEYGEVMPQGRAGMRNAMPDALARVSERLPAMVIDTLREQWARVARLDQEIGEIERRIGVWHRGNADSKRIAEIPGVGVLTATAVVAAMGDPAAFRSGREFAAWLGLVPRHEGTGGRVRMLGISKRGDRYLRTLLIHGARSVLTHAKAPPEPEGGERGVGRGRAETPVDQLQDPVAQLLGIEIGGRGPVMPGQPLDLEQVGALRALRRIGDAHLLDHALAEGTALRRAGRFSGHHRSSIMTARRRADPATDRRRDRC